LPEFPDFDIPELDLQHFRTASFDPCDTDLDCYHRQAEFEAAALEGSFTKVNMLGVCSRGDGVVELHKWMRESCQKGESVAVKRVPISSIKQNRGKERNEQKVHRMQTGRDMEDVLTEIGIYSYLRRQQVLHPFILQMHMAIEVGNEAWLVLQHADGGDLCDAVKGKKDEISSAQALQWTEQLLQAVSFLHKHRIGHRDISLENILLRDGNILLMDFGQAVQTESDSGCALRYFCSLGKDYYRAPERYVPTQSEVKVVAPMHSLPGNIAFVHAATSTGDCMCEVILPANTVAGQECIAEPWGYAVPPVDVFSCGVCLFMMITGSPPWGQARPSDGHFSYVQKKGIASMAKVYRKYIDSRVEDLLTAMLQANPAHRATVTECLGHTALTTHAKAGVR
jgi:serine/threonine protein kinase